MLLCTIRSMWRNANGTSLSFTKYLIWTSRIIRQNIYDYNEIYLGFPAIVRNFHRSFVILSHDFISAALVTAAEWVPWLQYNQLYLHGHYFVSQRMPVWQTVTHDDVIKWKHFPRYWPFARGIHRSPVNTRTKASDTELWCFIWYSPE